MNNLIEMNEEDTTPTQTPTPPTPPTPPAKQ